MLGWVGIWYHLFFWVGGGGDGCGAMRGCQGDRVYADANTPWLLHGLGLIIAHFGDFEYCSSVGFHYMLITCNYPADERLTPAMGSAIIIKPPT